MGASWLSLTALLGLGVVVLLAGAVLLVLGVRGRLVSTNPHCRKCKFDLVGLASGAEEPKCPECGSDLRPPGSVRKGLRRKRVLLASFGALLLLVPIALVSISVITARGPSIHSFKPDFWLMFEARNASPGSISPQLTELFSRLQAGSLSPGNSAALIERALAVQADASGGWDPAWGDIMDFAAVNGLLSVEQLMQNAKNAGQWVMLLRPTIVDGDDWVVCVMMRPGRVGNTPVGRMPMVFQPKLMAIRIGDREIDLSDGGAAMLGIHSSGGSAMTVRKKLAGVPYGQHAVTAVWELSVLPDYSAPAIVTWTEERNATITILAAGTRGVDLIEDPGAREAVQKSLKLSEGITVSKSAAGDDGTPHVGYSIQCTNPPLDLAFDVIARERLGADAPGGTTPREWKLGTVSFTRGGSHSTSGGMDVSGFDAAAVDLVLRPSTDAAKGTLGTYKIWDGEVWFRDVPINDPNATQRANAIRARGYGGSQQATPLPEATAP